jgi:hypothetical protein
VIIVWLGISGGISVVAAAIWVHAAFRAGEVTDRVRRDEYVHAARCCFAIMLGSVLWPAVGVGLLLWLLFLVLYVTIKGEPF